MPALPDLRVCCSHEDHVLATSSAERYARSVNAVGAYLWQDGAQRYVSAPCRGCRSHLSREVVGAGNQRVAERLGIAALLQLWLVGVDAMVMP